MLEGAYLFIIFASVVAAVWYSNRAILKPLAEVLDEGRAEVNGILTPYIDGHFHGREVRLAVDQERRPETFRIELFTGKACQLQVKKRTIWTSVERRLRRTSYTMTQDAQLDARFAVYSSPRTLFAAWLVSPEVRASIEELFDRQGIREISHEGGRLWASFEFHLSRKCSPARVRSILEYLTKLLHSLEKII